MSYPKDTSHFLCQHEELAERLAHIDPAEYDKTRNYLDGAVTWLSPFITHGIISTLDVANAVLKSHSSKDSYKLRLRMHPSFDRHYTACEHWGDATDARQWLYPKPEKPYKSFSQFWKQVKGDSAK